MTGSSPPLLAVDGLTVAFPSMEGVGLAARAIDFEVAESGCLGLVGESGSGKSVTLRALVGLVPKPGKTIAGEVRWSGRMFRATDDAELARLRGADISMIFQDPTVAMNPVISVGDQIIEVLRVKNGLGDREARLEAVRLLDRVGIPSPSRRMRDYAHQLSGGICQRVMIAIAIACRPRLLLADEPTTALDVTVQDQILTLLDELRAENGMAMILVSHDLAVVAERADRIAVMYAGYIVEQGPAADVLRSPRHPYTQGLLDALPSLDPRDRAQPLVAIPGQPPNLAAVPPGCPFAARCPHARPECGSVAMRLDRPPSGHGTACPFVDVAARRAKATISTLPNAGAASTMSEPIIAVRDLVKTYMGRRGIVERLQRSLPPDVRALDGVSLDVRRNEVLGLVGESGSGKTTLARCIVRLVEPDAGQILALGTDVISCDDAALRQLRRRVQIIYQDPYSSLNPRMSIGEAIGEAARVHGLVRAVHEKARVEELLSMVGLPSGVATRRPRELSGGQRQRVAIARALAVEPEVLIADEAVSALDVSVQAQVLNLFAELIQELGLSMIFISHQLSVIARLADRVAVMYHGKVVEQGEAEQIFLRPEHPYTASLLRAIPAMDGIAGRMRSPTQTIDGDLADSNSRSLPLDEAPAEASAGRDFR